MTATLARREATSLRQVANLPQQSAELNDVSGIRLGDRIEVYSRFNEGIMFRGTVIAILGSKVLMSHFNLVQTQVAIDRIRKHEELGRCRIFVPWEMP